MTAATDRIPVTADLIDASQRVYLRKFGSWQRFHRGPRKSGQPLLKALPEYANCVMVAGCQRSGTTMLTRVIVRSQGFRSLKLTHDDELDAALALSGYIALPASSRYCFQTTYLNECFPEYRTLGPLQKLIWVVRNPQSVVYSMVYNWKRFALKELYDACGVPLAAEARLRRVNLPWPMGPSRMEKACLAYSGKISQILTIREFLPPQQLLVVDYDQLVHAPGDWLPGIFAFIGESYDPKYAAMIRRDSLRKATRLSTRSQLLIDRYCTESYRECARLVQPEKAR